MAGKVLDSLKPGLLIRDFGFKLVDIFLPFAYFFLMNRLCFSLDLRRFFFRLSEDLTRSCFGLSELLFVLDLGSEELVFRFDLLPIFRTTWGVRIYN